MQTLTTEELSISLSLASKFTDKKLHETNLVQKIGKNLEEKRPTEKITRLFIPRKFGILKITI